MLTELCKSAHPAKPTRSHWVWLEYNYGRRRGFWHLTPFGPKWNSPFLSSWIGPAALLAKIPWSNLALGFTNGAARGRQEIGWCFAWDLFGHFDDGSCVIATKNAKCGTCLNFSEAMGYHPKSFLERHVEGMQVASCCFHFWKDRHWVGIKTPAICQEAMASFGWRRWREHSKRWMGEFFRQGGLFWPFRTYF